MKLTRMSTLSTVANSDLNSPRSDGSLRADVNSHGRLSPVNGNAGGALGLCNAFNMRKGSAGILWPKVFLVCIRPSRKR